MEKLLRRLIDSIAIVFLAFTPAVPLPGQEAGRQSAFSDNQHLLEMHVPDGFTVTSVGDLIMPRPLSMRKDPGFSSLVSILRSSDVTFGNFEGTALDLRTFKGFPQAESGGSWLLATPSVARDLKEMGFGLVSRANNHATDWGTEGMLETDRLLDDAGIVHAGTGAHRAAARAVRYLDTTGGRIGLVAAASSFTPLSRAMPPLGEAPGRPGINPLRTKRYILVTPEQMQVLRGIRDAQPKGSLPPPIEPEKPTDLELFEVHYRVSDHSGSEYEMDPVDLQEILKSIRQGKENSDLLIASIHAHEPGNWSNEPADFLRVLAHAAIDHGADIFIGHGPHRLRGIEIYKGKPIFYSLGNFFFQLNLEEPIVADMWERFKTDPAAATDAEFEERRRQRMFKEDEYYQSVIAVSRFEKERVSEIRLYPVYLGASRDSDRGIPHAASPETARTILERLQRLSQVYGTAMEIRDHIGIIRVSPSK